MGILSDFDEREAAARPPAAPFQDTVGGSLRKGWSAGLKGAESQIRSLAGAAGEALGADEFAANRNAEAAALQREAQAIGPTVTHSSQVKGLRSGLNYAAGLVGSSAPVSLGALGAAALGGGAAVPAMLRAAAFTSPFEMGDVAQKIQADPQALQRGAGERLGDIALGGGVSALAQGVVPGMIGAKLAGAGARAAAGQSVGQILGRNIVGAGAMEGVAEGTGDAIKQYAANQDKALDWENIKENAIGGAVAGGAMGTIGAGADLTTRVAPQAVDAFGRARTSINERIEAAKTAAGNGAAAAPGIAGDMAAQGAAAARTGFDQMSDMAQQGMATARREFDAAAASPMGQKVKEQFNAAAASPAGQTAAKAASAVGKKGKALYERAAETYEKYRTPTESERAAKMARGEDPDIDLAEVANMTPEQVAAKVQESEANAPGVMQRMADDIRSKLTPKDSLSKTLDDVLANVSDVAEAAKKVAIVKQTFDAAQSVKSRLDEALADLNERVAPVVGEARRYAARKQAEKSVASGKYDESNTFDAETRVDQGDANTFDAEGKFVDEEATPAPNTINGRLTMSLKGKAAPEKSTPGKSARSEARKAFMADAAAKGMTEEQARAAYVATLAENQGQMSYGEATDRARKDYGSKQSLDDSGTQAAILRALQESGIATRRKEFFAIDGNINKLGTVLRATVEQLVDGTADRKTYTRMISLLGDDAEPLLNSIKRTLYEDLDPGEADNYFRGLAAMADVEKQDTGLQDSLGQLMTPRSLLLPPHEVRELMDLFVEHAQSNVASPTDTRNMAAMALGTGEAQRSAESRAVDKLYKQHFGDKSDAAYKVVEKHVKSLYRQAKDPLSTAPFEMDDVGNVSELDDDTEVMSRGVGQFDEAGNRLEEAPKDIMRFGLSRTSAAQDGKRKVELGGLPYSMKGKYAQENQRYAKQHLADLKAKYPDKNVTMVDGYIEVENRDTPGEFNDADIEAMRLDTKEYSRSPSRIEIPQEGGKNLILDAVKIAKTFRKKNVSSFEADTPKTRMQNTVEAFKQGVAQLMEQYDTTFDINDKAVIGYVGNKPLTWGDTKTMSFPNSDDRASDGDLRMVEEYRRQYAAARKEGDTDLMKQIGDDAKLILSGIAFNKDRELSGGDIFTPTAAARSAAKVERVVERAVKQAEANYAKKGLELSDAKRASIAKEARNKYIDEAGGFDDLRETDFGSDGSLNSAGLQRLLEGSGRRKVGKDENVVLADAALKEEELINRSNMDGSPQYVSDFANQRDAILNLASALEARNKPAAKAIGGRLRGLMDTLTQRVMTDEDKMELGRVLGQSTPTTTADGVRGSNSALPSQVAAIVNPLAEKYSPANVKRMVKLRKNIEPAEKTASPREGIEGDVTDNYDDINAELMNVSASERAPSTINSRVAVAKQTTRAAPAPAPKTINVWHGSGENAGLSNLAPRPFAVNGRNYVSVEHAYQSNKSGMFDQETFGKYTVAGRKIPGKMGTKFDGGWNLRLMKKLIEASFAQNPDAAAKLAATGDATITHTQDTGVWAKEFPRILAEVRAELGAPAPREGSPDPKAVAAKKAAFLERAASGDKALIEELRNSDDAKGLQRAAQVLPAGKALDAINERLAELVQDPDVAYGLQTRKYSMESNEKTDPNTANKPGSAPEIKAYIERVLGPGVKLAWKKMTHAGDFTRMKTHDLIRISVHALDPMSVAYHESLHGFFAKLRDAGATDIIGVLEKAAASPQVMAQLRERFKDQPAVLQQLKDPEERAAYMYQMWASDPTGFKITITERTVFRKIAAFIRSLLGMWSNDERALHIMNYFHDGSYAQNMTSPHAVRGALMAPGRNQTAESIQKLTEPLANLADAVIGTGSGRIRDTNIPSLIRLADLIKRPATQKGGDQGFIAAARIEATKRRGEVGMIFENFNEDALKDAMDSLQAVKPARTADGRAAAAMVKGFLQGMRSYMKQAGTDIGDLGPDYFPRVWDAHYISKNQQAFKDMLEPYIRSGEMQGSAEQLIRNLTSRDGNEFGIETHVPGMQHKKSRVLDFIKAGDAAQFLKKDLASTLNDYLTQATRRAEWDRRFGWDDKAKQTKLNTLFIDAKSEGATDAQLEMVKDYLKGIDGTLGDSINPDVRRVMGNMIVYQNVRLLPMAIFSMAVDPMGQMVRGGTLAQSYATLVRGIKSIPESWGGKVNRDEATELAELVGVVDSAMMNTVMGDIYTQGMVGGTARKINDKFFKLNLVEGMSRAFRIGASQAAMDFLKRHADPLKNTHSVRWMEELGIQAGDIQMAPGGKRIALTQAEGLSEAQEYRVHAAINQWVDGAMLRPDAADKPIWMNDPRFALVSHLKQFIFAFQKTILARVAHEMRNGNYSPAMVLASYVPIMMAVDTAKGLLQTGGETPEWKKGWGPAEYTGYAMERAGLFGVGQFGLDMAQESAYGGFAPIGVLGPTVEQLTDVVQVMGGDKQFGGVLLNSMPANALYRNIVNNDTEENSGATVTN